MSMKSGSMTNTYDCIVVGGGAAGMFAAATAAGRGLSVLLLEKNDRLGKKLLITGKGRCNVTNDCSSAEVLENVPRNGRFLYSAMDAFPPRKLMEYFNANGCRLKVERGNRVFPESDRAISVLDCLKQALHKNGVKICSEPVTELVTDADQIAGVKTTRNLYLCSAVILATGGMSYPTTGSTGDGYLMAQKLGHTIIEPAGSLVPLEISGTDCKDMQGLSLRNVGVKLTDAKGKVLYKDFGELLFTHFGVSGPTVLSASAHLKGEGCKLQIDLKPALDEGKLNQRILRDLEQYQNRTMENALTDLLPRSMIPVVLRRLGVARTMQANSFKKEQRRALLTLLKNFKLEITRKRPVAEAIVTAGGVKVSEIDPKTMGSKLVSGLYFAGEIIDCDAYTGGFNLQIAWATGYVAGMSVKTDIDKPTRIE